MLENGMIVGAERHDAQCQDTEYRGCECSRCTCCKLWVLDDELVAFSNGDRVCNVSFDLTQEELDNQVLIIKKSGEKVELSKLKFDHIPVTVEYDKMEAGQRYMVQQKQGSNQYFIIDRVPEEEG